MRVSLHFARTQPSLDSPADVPLHKVTAKVWGAAGERRPLGFSADRGQRNQLIFSSGPTIGKESLNGRSGARRQRSGSGTVDQAHPAWALAKFALIQYAASKESPSKSALVRKPAKGSLEKQQRERLFLQRPTAPHRARCGSRAARAQPALS